MRVILTLLLFLGIATMVLARLEQAEQLARWSNVYALFEKTGDRNPFQSKEIQGRFDSIVTRKDPLSTALFVSGLFTSILAIAGLLKVTRSPRQAEDSPSKSDSSSLSA
jgi:hypothetical protein